MIMIMIMFLTNNICFFFMMEIVFRFNAESRYYEHIYANID